MKQYKVIRTMQFKEVVYVDAENTDLAIDLASRCEGEVDGDSEVVDMTAVLIIN